MRHLIWAVGTFALTASFGLLAAYNLANYRPVTNDEVELIAVGYKLATQGVLGSDLYGPFFGADQHFFITLPLQHVLEAASFRLFGAGVLQARLVSVLAGMSIVWLVGLLAYRWYGLGAALVCEVLLVAWPSNLTAASNGLPLLGVARTARYDVLAVAFGWLALGVLALALRRPRASNALALGVCCGVAALTQFMGTFVLPVVLVNWLFAGAPRRLLVWVAAGAAMVVLPWLAYGARYASDVAGQLTVYAGRGDFLHPEFYVQNVTTEIGRYEHLARSADLSWALLVLGVWPALAYVIWRSRRAGHPADRIVWTSLVAYAGLLLLLDHGKSSVYAIVLVPSICLALSRLGSGLVARLWRTRALLGVVAGGIGLALLLGVVREGVAAYQLTLAQADDVSPYDAVGVQIEQALAPGASVLGPERWWWAVHAHPYRSLRSVWWQMLYAPGASFADADYVIVNDNVRADILLFPEPIQRAFEAFLSACTVRMAHIDDPNYFGIDIYRTFKNC